MRCGRSSSKAREHGERMLTVVTGPPCSGKSTYVRTHAVGGDIVIDFDELAVALGSPVRHGHAPAIVAVTRVARSAAIGAALRAHGQGSRVWIVDTIITPRSAQMYEDAGAEIVTLSVAQDELHRRAHAERPKLWHKLINEWRPSVTIKGSDAPTRAW
jgi:hypothetical protein